MRRRAQPDARSLGARSAASLYSGAARVGQRDARRDWRGRAGGAADADAQDAFCGGAGCTIAAIFDQSPRGNHLDGRARAPRLRRPRGERDARAFVTLGGRKVYGACFEQEPLGDAQGGRLSAAIRVQVATARRASAKATSPSRYMVLVGHHFNGACCFDYGNADPTTSATTARGRWRRSAGRTARGA